MIWNEQEDDPREHPEKQLRTVVGNDTCNTWRTIQFRVTTLSRMSRWLSQKPVHEIKIVSYKD